MILVGDIHGKVKEYNKLLDLLKVRITGEPSIQLGDFGVGFKEGKLDTDPIIKAERLPDNSYFIRGNHDNPELCKQSKHYLGDYGYKDIEGIKVFFVSGAWSIDRAYRTEGISWWPGEELSYTECEKAFDLYTKIKPDLVISHDGPFVATYAILNQYRITSELLIPEKTRTGNLLNAMYEVHQPDKWFFGHWHTSLNKKIGSTQFICLPELGWTRISK